ncbi:MAG TPA: methyltransferase domain-containing protein [Bryobacteraceae bacterium]|nr:methyltransferase domain-containing protein [Bryobacteraceae bacterium]
MPLTGDRATIDALHVRRTSQAWRNRLRRWLEPPRPFIMNPGEPKDFPLGRWNLYIGGAAARPDGYVNIDLFAVPGVDVACDAESLPFPAGVFTRVECDAVLEHVVCPETVMREIERILAPGGYAHVVTPFCHPFHEYPRDYRRFTPDGLKLLRGGMDVVAEGWRTGPAATLLVFALEGGKLLLPWRWWRAAAHFTLGWLLWPLRYLDAPLLNTPAAGRIGNHCYVWFRKPAR